MLAIVDVDEDEDAVLIVRDEVEGGVEAERWRLMPTWAKACVCGVCA